MSKKSYAKILSANDLGKTGSHQAGILVPKTDAELLSFFPRLSASIKNPDAWIYCEDEVGRIWKMRFVYYNNKLHVPKGTRNEFRITYMTEYLRICRAQAGDSVVFVESGRPHHYRIHLAKSELNLSKQNIGVIKLRGWRRVH